MASMIFLLVFTELGDYLSNSGSLKAGLDHAHQVKDVFRRPDHKRLYEFVRFDNALLDIPPGRVVITGQRSW
jgi:hypothetical protein